MSDTQEKLYKALMTGPNRWAEATINGKLVSYYEVHDASILLALIESAKREAVIEELQMVPEEGYYGEEGTAVEYIKNRLAQLKQSEEKV